MPFKSKAQQRLFFSKQQKGELPKGTAERWAKHTPNIKALPEKVHTKKAYEDGVKAAVEAMLSGNSCVDKPKPKAGLSLDKTTKEPVPLRYHKSSLENSWEHKKASEVMNKQAYDLGVQAALVDAGLVKQADDVEHTQALAALERNRTGQMAGLGLGAVGGAGIGALIAALLKHPEVNAGNGAMFGGLVGALPGLMIGHAATRVPEDMRQHITAGDIYL
jgi:hypothetical protein